MSAVALPSRALAAGPGSNLAIAGPTAAGKTAAALAVADALAASGRPVEIISVDSALVYRGLDIGTAKPTATERARVPHHLIDILDPADAYSAGRFVDDATRIAAEIRARGHLPLFVGGTMLYFKAVADGIDAMPAADRAIRAAIDAEATERGWPALHVDLARIDPVTAARLAPGDSQRIQRALEVFKVSGQALSSFHHRGAMGPAPAQLTVLSLEPDDRAWLHRRIAERFASMLAGGLIDEVRALRSRGDLDLGHPSMRCVGYRQVWEALDRGEDDALESLAERGTAATRQLAKRQLTWLRSMRGRHRVAADSSDAIATLVAFAREWAGGD